MFWLLQGERATPAAGPDVTGAADLYYSPAIAFCCTKFVLCLLTQFRSCHSNISVYAPAISITTAAAAATNAFIPLLLAENAGCQMLLLERLCFAARWRIFCSTAALQR